MALRSNDDQLKLSIPCSADLTDYQHRFANLSGADAVSFAGAGEVTLGILQNNPDAIGKGASIAVAGVSMLELGGTVTRLAWLKSDAAGRGVATTTDTNVVGAIALAAGVITDKIPVIIVHVLHAG